MSIEERIANLETTLGRVERMLNTLVGDCKPRSDPRKYMNVKEASCATGLSEQTLRIYCNNGTLRYTKVGKHLIIHTDSLYKYIEQTARKTIAEQANERLKNLTS